MHISRTLDLFIPQSDIEVMYQQELEKELRRNRFSYKEIKAKYAVNMRQAVMNKLFEKKNREIIKNFPYQLRTKPEYLLSVDEPNTGIHWKIKCQIVPKLKSIVEAIRQ